MILTIAIISAVIIYALSADSSWGNVLSSSRNNLVFDGRIQAYGAYALRKEHPRTVLIAVLISAGMALAGLLLLNGQNEHKAKNIPFVQVEDWDITIPPIENQESTTLAEKSPSRKSELAISTDPEVDREVEIIDEQIEPPKSIFSSGNQGASSTGNSLLVGDGEGTDSGSGSGNGTSGNEGATATVFEVADYAQIMPEYPGGQAEMMKYMLSKVRYNDWDKERSVNGTMYISFVVNIDGSITNIEITRNIFNGENLANKAVKAIGEMPRWKPGSNGKSPVPVRYTMPITFKLKN